MRRVTVLLSLTICVQLSAHQPVRARRAMVVAQEPLAADVGVQVLKSGGNAIDAAIAVGFALAVTHPSAGNIGGGGFMLGRFADGRWAFFGFPERAAAGQRIGQYVSRRGGEADQR